MAKYYSLPVPSLSVPSHPSVLHPISLQTKQFPARCNVCPKICPPGAQDFGLGWYLMCPDHRQGRTSLALGLYR